MVRQPQHDEAELAADAAGAERPRQGERRALTAAAERALAEAAARRAALADRGEPPPEEGGRGGPDPARYGDWEVQGRAVDF